jgi:hypothetical protein
MNLPSIFTGACQRNGHSLTAHYLYINIDRQELTHFTEDLQTTFRVSTAINGTGQQKNSYQTPIGLHRIHEKIGEGEPIGTVFEGRKPVRLVGKEDSNDLITDRILWLEGLEPGLNQGQDVDTRNRYIYIHGVGDESTIGAPNSQGCIHLAATDLLQLFDSVPIGALVYIDEN